MNDSAKRMHLLLVEDDEVSREVLSLQMGAQRYRVDAVESGEVAVAWLEGPARNLPDAIVMDLQMPGLSGLELVKRLRETAAAKGSRNMVVVAMSGSRPVEDMLSGFNGFLLKPFTMEHLAGTLERAGTAFGTESGKTAGVPAGTETASAELDEAVYARLAASMPATQLQQLYALLLSDAEARMEQMRGAAQAGDDGTYRKEAHAIKGGCSIVGAIELHGLAAAAEQGGISPANHVASLDEMQAACVRLRRILRSREDRAAM